jgi:uncharacterized protein (DUF427 family)
VSTVKIPGPDHPITIEPVAQRVTVRAGDRIVAESKAALRMQEASYPPVFYIPLADVDQTLLTRSDSHTYCPYKGTASYYNLVTGGDPVTDAIWTYEQPYDAVKQIAGHVAFYAQNVEISAVA